MTSRMAGLDSNNSISSDLNASSSSLKKTGHNEIKFQNVLASTKEKSQPDSGDKNPDTSNSEHKKNNDVKADQSGLRSQVQNKKISVNMQTSEALEIVEEDVDIEAEIVAEIVENQELKNTCEMLLSVAVQPNNEVLVPADETVGENLEVQAINLDSTEVEVSAAGQNLAQTTIIDTNEIESTNVVRENELAGEGVQVSEPRAQVAVIQAAPVILKDLKIQDSLDENVEVLSVEESTQDQEAIAQDNRADIAAPVRTVNVEGAVQEEAPASRDNFNSFESSNNKVSNQIAQEKPNSTKASDSVFEETVAAFNGAPNAQESVKVSKDNTTLKNPQNILSMMSSDDLLPLDQGLFEQGESDEFNSLFSKMDNFVTINDGKLAVDFKEIANLPEENIPHRADQISIAVKSAVGRGQSEISLRMYPEDLGAVDVKIEFSEVGKVQSIKFFATKESTLELLQKDYSILERSLKEVINAEDASLSFNLKDGKGEGSEYQPQENFGLNNFAEGSQGGERIATLNYQATLQIQEDDQVDITV